MRPQNPTDGGIRVDMHHENLPYDLENSATPHQYTVRSALPARLIDPKVHYTNTTQR